MTTVGYIKLSKYVLYITLCGTYMGSILVPNSNADESGGLYHQGFESIEHDKLNNPNCNFYSVATTTKLSREGNRALAISYNKNQNTSPTTTANNAPCGMIQQNSELARRLAVSPASLIDFSFLFSGDNLATASPEKPAKLEILRIAQSNKYSLVGLLTTELTNDGSITDFSVVEQVTELQTIKDERLLAKIRISPNKWNDVSLSTRFIGNNFANVTGRSLQALQITFDGINIAESLSSVPISSREVNVYLGLNIPEDSIANSAEVYIDAVRITPIGVLLSDILVARPNGSGLASLDNNNALNLLGALSANEANLLALWTNSLSNGVATRRDNINAIEDEAVIRVLAPTSRAKETRATRKLGLWDQGFTKGIVRSDIGDKTVITVGKCLYNEATCPPNVLCSKCPTGPANYSKSNFFTTVSPAPKDNYWILDHNVDVGEFGGAFNNECNSGPPNQSQPVNADASGKNIFNLAITPSSSSSGIRATMTLRHRYSPCQNSVPYIAIGANKNRGNGKKPIGGFVALTDSTTKLDTTKVNFKSGITVCAAGKPCVTYFYLYTSWKGKRRMLILTYGSINHSDAELKHAHWNWPVKESYFYSGYDIAYIRCSVLGIPCLSVDPNGKTYSIKGSWLLQEASKRNLFDEPIPLNTPIYIDGVSWAMETTGTDAESSFWVEGISTDYVADAAPPKAFFAKKYNRNTRHVTLKTTETLYGKVTGLDSDSAKSCLEVKGRPGSQVNGEGWCNDTSHWSTMVNSSAANSWTYKDGVWRLEVRNVGSVFPPDTYVSYWKNSKTGHSGRGTFTVREATIGRKPSVSFSKVLDKRSTSVTLSTGETLYGRADNLTASNAQGCFEVKGRPAGELNGKGYCADIANYVTMTSSSQANSWSYDGVYWRLTVSPVSNLWGAGSYRSYWRNTKTGQVGKASFKVK